MRGMHNYRSAICGSLRLRLRPRQQPLSQALDRLLVSPTSPQSLSSTPTSKRFLHTRFRAVPTPAFQSLTQPRQASYLWSIALVAFVLGSATAAQLILANNPDDLSTVSRSDINQPPDHNYLGPINTLKMSSSQVETGHVGNLTAEQEIKLREMWTVLFRLFGVKFEAGEAQRAASVTSTTTPESPDTKKKGRRSLFGWGAAKKEEPPSVESTTASLGNVVLSDADDKFGQNKEFKQALADIPPDQLREAFWNMVKADHPDALVLRFLRARKWDVNKAIVMLVSTLRWRLSEMHVDDDIMLGGEAGAIAQAEGSDATKKRIGQDFIAQMRMGKSFIHGVDKQGRPMCLIRVRMHKIGAQVGESVERYTVHMIETARLMLPRPVETAVIIFDMTGFTLANMDYTPVKFIIKCFEANYPESLGAVLIHQAPWVFSGIWKVIKGWLDPVVAAKVHFTNSVEDLEGFIDRKRIIKELGGDEDFDYEYIEQQPGENDPLKDTAKRDEILTRNKTIAEELQEATKSWIEAANKGDKAGAEAWRPKREEIIERLNKGYWELDPYVRARSFYDRSGVIQGGGIVDFYPEQAAQKKANGRSTEANEKEPVTNGNGTAEVEKADSAAVPAETPAVATN
ncbi:CRAL-TRIO domain-containing protein C3H8,02 [Talaromyces islandicus]|uniref:CRAL-TRIO domain-containing protein C3H8,02 n=1 Tax=Talaromyces islandicus TaxID=28573 RepID=A0A0U1LWJ0_TALIS|nr:CRAL-TRIO domain-containing protein C3H8,02 [Talaromyces islandicus]